MTEHHFVNTLPADKLTRGRIEALEAVGNRFAALAAEDSDGDENLTWALRLMSSQARMLAFGGLMHRAGTVEREMAQTLTNIAELPEAGDE